MVEHLQSGDQIMGPEDLAWQATPHFCEIGCIYMQRFTSQIFGIVDPLGENLDFFSPLGLTNSDHKPYKIKFYSVRALKRYLNEKNLIHGRVMATISKFSPQIFETYFRSEIFSWLKISSAMSEMQEWKSGLNPPVNLVTCIQIKKNLISLHLFSMD